MSLARVYDAGENAFIRDQLHGGAWLGGSDLAASGDWRWLEGDAPFWSGGESGAPLGGLYVNWANGRPLGGPAQDCLLTNADGHGRWFSTPCQKEASWVCAGPAQADPRPPELSQCAMIRHGNGRWTAAACDVEGGYVCETVPPDANKRLDQLATLIRDDYRAWKPRISHLQMKAGVTITDPFSAYGGRMGLRECVDSLGAGGEPRAIPGSGLEEQQYDQLYKGIPVLTKGYAVLRDPASKAVLSYTGTFEHDINVATKPVITEGKASDFARAAVSGKGKKKGSAPTDGELVIYPATQGPKHAWELAWVFAVPPASDSGGYTVAVSAIDGHIISAMAWSQEQPVPDCPSVDVNTTPNVGSVDLSVFALPQADFLDPPDARATKLASGLYPVALLSAGTSGTPSGAPALTKPQIRVQCDTEEFPKIAVLDSTQVETSNGGQSYDVHIWNLADPSSVRGAGILTAAQRCLEYYAKTFHYQTPTPVPWLGIDGPGAAPVDIRMWRTTDVPTFIPTSLQPRAGNINFPPEYYVGASLDTVCHEIAHALWFYGAPSSAYPPAAPANATIEHRSLNEGFADVMASATELDVRGAGHGEWCIGGDRFDPRDSGCTFDLADLHNPDRNAFPDCAFRNADGVTLSTQCPWDYHSPDYCTFPDACNKDVTDGCCEYHRNGTVLSHWYWTLADPDAQDHGLNGNNCKYWVDPLDAGDSVLAARKATNILFTAMKAGYMPASPDYPAMAHATLTAATDLFGLGSDEAIRVFRAWYGVSVIEESYIPGLAAPVEPAREAESVYPWTKFAWPIHTIDPNENAWDLQVANGVFDLVTPFEKDGITSTETRTGPNNQVLEVGVWPVALPIDTGTNVRYFWRVRPSVPGDPWNDCFSINSFVGTTHPDDVKNIEVTGEFSQDDDKVYPGTVSFQWDGVRGATGYKVQVAPYLTDCQDTTAPFVIQKTVDVDFAEQSPPPVVTSVDGVQPESNYFINIASIGPVKNNWGDKAEYGCYHLPFTTTKMRPPELQKPDFNDALVYGAPVTFRWIAPDGPEACHIQLFEMLDESGACDPNVAREMDAPCGDLVLAFADLPNPPGYCWRVNSIAKNGSESPYSDEGSDRWGFHYYWSVAKLSPGVDVARVYNEFDPAPLSGDSYGAAVTLTWAPDALGLAAEYKVKLGKFPWDDHAIQPDPHNCVWPNVFGCLDEPSEIIFNGVVDSNTMDFPADSTPGRQDATLGLASKGRYCWTVWPILAGPRQPLVNIAPIYCYTSGPAPIVEIHVDNPPPDQGFIPGPITGYILYPFLPDGQGSWTSDSSDPEAVIDFSLGDGCEPSPVCPFADYFDCHVNFTISPHEGQTYQINAYAFNSTVSPPEMNLNTLVQQQTKEIKTATCGASGETCCAEDTCDTHNLVCQNGTCVHCGDLTDPCCDTFPACDSEDNWCEDQQCKHCGLENEPCCFRKYYDKCPGNDPARPLHCSANGGASACVKCGGPGEPCCDYPECKDNSACLNGFCPDGGTGGSGGSGGGSCTLDDVCDYWTDPACCPGLGCVSSLYWINKNDFPNYSTAGACTKCGDEGERCCHTPWRGTCNQIGLECVRSEGPMMDWCLPPCGGKGESCCLLGTSLVFCDSGNSCDGAHCYSPNDP